ncbi:MAG: DUF262 domain-containing protein [Opitutaceae bacterium]
MERYTFNTLLRDKHIRIPRIQRDYAQGRNDTRTNDIRTKFVQDIHQSLTLEIPLDLGLLFGSSQGEDLILIDGQQRATTLFLLHWLLRPDTNIRWLDRFTYETRISARDFCKFLTKFDSSTLTDEPSIVLKNQKCFCVQWCDDPTVAGMLKMLDSLHCQFNSENRKYCWDRLIAEDSPITFQHLDIAQYELNDSLYVKMNARGRPLTEFEKFKAWLEAYVSKKGWALGGDWKGNIDRKWLNMLWTELSEDTPKTKESRAEYLGTILFNFFKFYAIHLLLVEADKPSEHENLVTRIRENKYLSSEDLKQLFTESRLRSTFKLLDRLTSHPPKKWHDALNGLEFFREKSNENKSILAIYLDSPNFSESVRFHAFCCYAGACEQDAPAPSNQVAWKQSSRVVRNLTINADINSSNYANAIRSIDCLLCQSAENENQAITSDLEIYKRLQTTTELKGISSDQTKEECKKAELILNSLKWEEEFFKYENHDFFRGQIGFLLEISKEANSSLTLECFNHYAKIAASIFNNKPLEAPFLLQRALLRHGDYLIRTGYNLSFGKDRAAWKQSMFRNNAPFITALKGLVDELEEEQTLENLLKKTTNTGDWRRHFIEDSEGACIAKCEHSQNIRIHYNNKNDIRLLKGVALSGWHSELRTYSLYAKLNRLFKANSNAFEGFKPHPWDSRGSSATPSTVLLFRIPNEPEEKYITIRVLYKKIDETYGYECELYSDPEHPHHPEPQHEIAELWGSKLEIKDEEDSKSEEQLINEICERIKKIAPYAASRFQR